MPPTCDVPMTCGRWAGHRGHHGGFRPKLRGATSTKLGPREYEALRLFALLGSQALIGPAMDCSIQTAKNHLTHAYAKLDVSGSINAFRAMGWLQVPTDQEALASMQAARVAEMRAELAATAAEAQAIADSLAEVPA